MTASIENLHHYLRYMAARPWAVGTPERNMADAWRELDAHLSAGGTPPEAWREGPDAVPANDAVRDQLMSEGQTWYHGTRAQLERGDRIVPGEQINTANYEIGWNDSMVWLTRNEREAREWADSARGEGEPVVYIVEPESEPEDWAVMNGWDNPTHDEWITTAAIVRRRQGEVPAYTPPPVSALITEVSSLDAAAERLEYLRGELRGELISQGELLDLQSLAPYIDPGDVELLEAAGVPEQDADLHALVVEYMAEDMLCQYDTDSRAAELGARIDAIVPGACDRMASHAVGTHMTPVEIVVWAGVRWEHCLSVMRGTDSDD